MNRLSYGVIAVAAAAVLAFQACGFKKPADDKKDEEVINVFTSDIEKADFKDEIVPTGDNPAPVSGNGAQTTTDAVDTAKTSGEKLYRWGIVRNKNNQPPNPSAGLKDVLEKHGGKYLGDTSKKTIYLTLDEGYENGYTPAILDTLKQKNVKACFFITGPYLAKHMNLVERMVNEGHTVGNHTVNHPSLPTVSSERIEKELIELDRVFYEKFGKNMRFLRPPKGEFNERSLEVAKRLGYTTVMWSFAYDDWNVNKQRGADYAYNMVINNLHNGAILLLHAVSKDNTDALGRIIDKARELGYEFESIENI